MSVRREYPKLPLVGASAVILRDGEVLLIKRTAPPKAGFYSIPGGLVEVGEKVQEAAKREVQEETGLVIEIERLIDVIDNIVRDDEGRVKYHYVIVDYLAKPVDGELKKSSDATDVRWVRFDELKNFELTETSKKLFKKLGLMDGSENDLKH